MNRRLETKPDAREGKPAAATKGKADAAVCPNEKCRAPLPGGVTFCRRCGLRLCAAPIHLWQIAALPIATILLLTLAFPPAGQFYLAWIGLVPWLVAVHAIRTNLRAFLVSWITGTLFFSANLWWLFYVTAPGMIALMLYCGFYFGVIALILRRTKLLDARPILVVPALAGLWVAGDFVRANLMTGFPWIFLGNTQTPILPMCQIADTLGFYGVTAWVVMINAWVALWVIRRKIRPLMRSVEMLGATLLIIACYGIWRMNQDTATPGPTVMVVQSNYPQSNKGEKGASDEELLAYHVGATEKGLDQQKIGSVDLVVWSETMMPAMNRQAITEYTQTWPCQLGDVEVAARDTLSRLAADRRVGILTGGRYFDQFHMITRDGHSFPLPTDSRNSAYLFQPDGSFDDSSSGRYDKIHLVPFGEFIPFKGTWLYALFLKLGPNYYADYEIQAGSADDPTVFHLETASGRPRWKFVTPICFEDLDSRLCAAMFRPGPDGLKRADFIVNITNDGWFSGSENADHLQSATFRSIENRVPTARSVNTGISGFIDSDGRTTNLIDPRVEGVSTQPLMLDSRISFYTRYGDVFAWLCVLATVAMIVMTFIRRGASIEVKPNAQ